MTPEQERALALARARKRRAEAQPAQASEPSWGDTAVDAAKSLGSGMLRGAAGLVGLPGTLQDLAASGLSWATGMEPTQGSYLSGNAIQGYISDLTGGASFVDAV